MFYRVRPHVRLPGRGFLVVFALTILLPGTVLAVFAVRALLQERRLADQQIRERLDRAAELAVRDVEGELREWQIALETLRRNPSAHPTLPDRLRRSLEEPGAAVIVFLGATEPRFWPERQLLYQPRQSARGVPLQTSPAGRLAEAESLELRDKDYPRAIDLYKRLLAKAIPDQHALLLHRLARTYNKAGLDEAALAAFRELESFEDRIGALPADLIAKYEICSHWAATAAGDRLGTCALDLYRELVGGRWLIEQSRYLFYATSVRKWLEGGTVPADEIARWTATEDRKRTLTDAVTGWLDSAALPAQSSPERRQTREMDAGTHLAFSWPGTRAESDAVALVVAKTWLGAHVWPETFAGTLAAGFDVTLLGQAGDVLFGSTDAAADKAGHTSWMVVRGMQDTTVSWRVRIRPRNPVALSADLARRQTVYLVTLVLVVALLGSGTYLTTRVVKKEMEIARLKSDFVSTVSHEFRSPLTGIRQLGEMLMHGRVPNEDRRQEYYERITRESDRLARLVENLLDFSRMEEGRKEYRFERLDPSPWLRDVVSDCQSLLGDRSTFIISAIPEGLPCVAADPDALRCAVQNLIDNAVKYSPGREAVWVDAAAANSHVTIRVRDEGIGISSSDRTRIFEKFYRGGGDSAREVKGAGLGLSLVQHIVLAHGGRVECESRPGEGTTFSMHLKVAPPAPPV